MRTPRPLAGICLGLSVVLVSACTVDLQTDPSLTTKAGEAFDSLKSAADSATQTSDHADSVLTEVDGLLDKSDGAVGSIKGASESATKTFDALYGTSEEAKSAFSNIASLADSVRESIEELDQKTADLIDTAAATAASLGQAADETKAAATQGRSAFEAVAAAAEATQRLVEAMAPVLDPGSLDNKIETNTGAIAANSGLIRKSNELVAENNDLISNAAESSLVFGFAAALLTSLYFFAQWSWHLLERRGGGGNPMYSLSAYLLATTSLCLIGGAFFFVRYCREGTEFALLSILVVPPLGILAAAWIGALVTFCSVNDKGEFHSGIESWWSNPRWTLTWVVVLILVGPPGLAHALQDELGDSIRLLLVLAFTIFSAGTISVVCRDDAGHLASLLARQSTSDGS